MAFDFTKVLSESARLTGPLPWGPPAARPARISFGGGIPDPEHVPVAQLLRASQRALAHDGGSALTYGGLYGYERLRDILVDKVRSDDGVSLERDQVVITNGSSQAIALVCGAFVRRGDTVFVEAPTFAGSLRAFQSFGATIVAVPLDEQGMRLDVLERELARVQASGGTPKAVYTIANFNNPSGLSLSAERRKRLLKVAENAGVLVVEDDAYGDLRYEGVRPPSLLSIDAQGLAIKLGTFSKVVAAGLRIGWAVGHPDAIAAMTSVRHDMGVSPWLTRTLAEWLSSGNLGPHLEAMLTLYRGKRDAMLSALEEYCAPHLRWQRPEGGFFVWAEMSSGIDPDRFTRAAAEEGIGYVPGTAFFQDGRGRRHIRLAFSHVHGRDIDPGVAALGRALESAGRSS